MIKTKAFYLFDLGIITLVMGTLFFSVGWHMGHHDCKQKVEAALKALKADAIHEASQALQRWVQGCDSLDEIYTMPCPRPYGQVEVDDEDVVLDH